MRIAVPLLLLSFALLRCGSSDSDPAPTGIDDPAPSDSDGEPGDNEDVSGNGDEPNTPADDDPEPGVVDITDLIFSNQDGNCTSYANTYLSDVADVQRSISFMGSLTITASGGKCLFETNAIPNHDFNNGGSFATAVSAQNARYEMTSSPEIAANPTELILGDDAIFLNGVKLDLLAAACYAVGREPLGREKIGCGQDEIDNPWRYDPMSALNEFGTDNNNAHTQPDGTYHYHGNPMAMFETDCESASTASPVIGFAADGFPIHGSCIADGGIVRKAQSSFVFKDEGGPRQTVSGYQTPSRGSGTIASSDYDGQFRGDYEYSEGAGDLDICNGMTVDGQYGYYVTDAYPWVIGCFSGTPDGTFYRLRP